MLALLRSIVSGRRAIRVAEPEDVASLFEGLRGSHRFGVTGKGHGKFATLRLDPENSVLSGDLFDDFGRSQWYLSWRSEAIYRPCASYEPTPWDFAALSTVWRADGGTDVSSAKVFLAAKSSARHGDDGSGQTLRELSECRIGLIENRQLVSEFRLDTSKPRERCASFRQIKLFFDLDPRLLEKDDVICRAVSQITGFKYGTKTIAKRLAEEHIRAEIKSEVLPSEDISAAGEKPMTIFNVLQQNRSRQRSNALTIYLSAHGVEADNSDDPRLGVALGLDRYPKRFGNGRAAIVFPNKIAHSMIRQKAFNPAKKDEKSLTEDDLCDLAFRIEFIILHEIGHLLNLPHAWQRDRFDMLQLDARPQAVSWMNYGSLFPFGDIASCAMRAMDTEKEPHKERDTRDELAQFNLGTAKGPLRKAKFTAQERMHLFHAPYDLFIPKGRTFVDDARTKLEMKDSSGEKLSLTIGDMGPQSKVDDVTKRPTVRLKEFGYFPTGATFQPPHGSVKLKLEGKMSSVLPFRFGAGGLFWLFREECPVIWTNHRLRPEACFSPDLSVLVPEKIPPMANLQATEGKDEQGKTFSEYEVPLPVLSSSFLFTRFTNAKSFTTQVAYVEPGGQSIAYSNQIALIYEEDPSPSPFGAATESIKRLMTDERLQSFVEAALYFGAEDLDFLNSAPEIVNALKTDEVQEAVYCYPGLEWLQRILAITSLREILDRGEDATNEQLAALEKLSGTADLETKRILELQTRSLVANGLVGRVSDGVTEILRKL